MDLGASVCSRAKPACVICPLQDACVARREGRTAELPTPKPSKTLPEREAVALLLRDAQQRVLLQKRPDTGIWAQLWTLPQAEAGSDLQDWFDAHVDGSLEDAEELPVLQHTFSHYRLHLQILSRKVRGLRVEEPTLRWVANDELPALGLPAPIRNCSTAPRSGRQNELPRNPATTSECHAPNRLLPVRTTRCRGPDFVPYPGELGQRIFNNIGKQAWAAWLAHQTMLINENRLSPRTPEHRAFLEGELVKFLFEKDAEKPAGFVPKPDLPVAPGHARRQHPPGMARRYPFISRIPRAPAPAPVAAPARTRAAPSHPACGCCR